MLASVADFYDNSADLPIGNYIAKISDLTARPNGLDLAATMMVDL